ncbi:MAG: Type IV pilus biogenesis protein [Parcubacteria group bacterium GW2011_GWA2_43_11]|nr:MAG: Type IV pilus biogenesis protein [Parcubacteria group bacterium GW2011_GWC2_42_11]KKS85038.1 MAG: Type IV pilus biogenesis protein [Parcubacteria group bacterium GW2011_GWA2_43_11]
MVTKVSRGFTFVELMVTIAIIGILSAVVFPSLTGARERARDAERVTEVGQIALGIELYYNTCRAYPATLTTSANNGCPSSITLATFLPTIPVDPKGVAYGYGTASGAFVVAATLETTNHSSLANDVDTTVGGVACDDAGKKYCKGG